MAEFKDILKKLLDDNNTNAEKISNEINNISANTIRNYIKGTTIPKSMDNIRILADYFNVSVDYLQGLSDEPTLDVDSKKIFRKYGLTSQTLESLEKIKESKRQLFALEILINQNTFLEQLTDYLINSNINVEINDNQDYYKFATFEKSIKVDSKDTIEKSFYMCIGELKSLFDYSKEKVSECLTKNRDILMEYCEQKISEKDFVIPLDCYEAMTGKSYWQARKEDSEYFLEEKEKFEKSEKGKELIKEYKGYKERKFKEYNERKRDRKK